MDGQDKLHPRSRFPVLAAALLAAGSLACAYAGQSQTPAQTAPQAGGNGPQSPPAVSNGTGTAPSRSADTTTALTEHWLDVAPSTIEHKTLVNSEGAKLGDVTGVVRNKRTGEISAVVSVGGFLGIGWLGGKEVTVPLKRMHLQANNVILFSPLSRGDLLAQAQPYRPDDYTALEGNTPLGQLAGVVPSPQGGGHYSFAELDTDNNGLLTRSESRREESLVESWDKYDKDGDNRLDRAEFGLFLQQQDRQRQKESPPEV